jgi:hypothetical protein
MEVIGFLYVSLDSRRACACSEAGCSSQNGDRAWGVYYGRAAFVVRLFCGQKDSIQRMFIKKCFLFTIGSVCRVKRFTTGSRNSLMDVRKSRIMADQARKWLRQQSKDFRSSGFDALVMRWDKGISVGGDMSRNKCFSQVRISHVLRFISICDLFTDSSSYITQDISRNADVFS